MVSPLSENTVNFSLLPPRETGDATEAQPLKEEELTDQEQQEVRELEQREDEVITHEQAHRMTGGRYVRGGISYEYETGPDGKRYISGGEVSIDTAPVEGDPQATIDKMQTVRQAALAPASPSSQDRRVAADASRKEQQARQDLQEEKAEEQKERMASAMSQPGNATKTAPENTTAIESYQKQGKDDGASPAINFTI